jgi:uncharacterized protein
MKTIYLAVLGSRGYGVANEDSDTDMMGVTIEEPEAILGFGNFEQTIETTEKGQTTIYGLRKYLRLALKGNPTINELLWADSLVKVEPYTSDLIGLRRKLLSKQTLKSYYWYLDDQIARLKGERGQKNVNRQHLAEKHGYDTKYAYHIIRLSMMGQTLGQTGRLYMPLDPFQQQVLREIRNGEWPVEKVYDSAETGKQGIQDYIKCSDLPEKGDWKATEDWLMSVYRREYGLGQ